MNDTAKVWIANMTTLCVITLANVQAVLAIVLTLISIAFTIDKWRKGNKD